MRLIEIIKRRNKRNWQNRRYEVKTSAGGQKKWNEKGKGSEDRKEKGKRKIKEKKVKVNEWHMTMAVRNWHVVRAVRNWHTNRKVTTFIDK